MSRGIIRFGFSIVGSIIGGPVGFLIGSAIGAILFPPIGSTIEGPRLGDLSVTSASYGAPIQKSFGTIRMGGNIIWSTEIEEVKNENKVGGKGLGGSQKQVTYEYFGSFAISFGVGIAENVTRIWADGKLIYDGTNNRETTVTTINGVELPPSALRELIGFIGVDFISKDGLEFRFYPGDETQEPDSLIEADIGIDKTPAFRGLTYIVFDRLSLTDFGNRIPNITAEITFNATDTKTVQTLDKFTVAEGGLTDLPTTVGNMIPDFNRGVGYFVASSSTVGQNFIRRFQINTMLEDRQQVYNQDTNSTDVKDMVIHTVIPNGLILMTHGVSVRNPICIINPDSLEIVDTFGLDVIGSGFSSTQFPQIQFGAVTSCTARGTTGLKHFIIAPADIGAEFGILAVSDSILSYVYDTETDNQVILGSRSVAAGNGAISDGFGECYLMTQNASDPKNIHLYKITVLAESAFSATVGKTNGVTVDLLASYTADDLVSGSTSIVSLNELMYDETDDNIIFEFESSISNHLVKLNTTTGDIIWVVDLSVSSHDGKGMNNSRLQDGVYTRVRGSTSVSFRTATGELFDTTTGWPEVSDVNVASWWDSKTNAFMGGDTSGDIHKFLLFRGAGQGALLSDVVSDICLTAGLLASDIDVTNLASENVPGYMIGRQTSARSAIQLLTQAYFFDGVESDFKLKFTLRAGKTSTASFVQDDLATLSRDTNDFFVENRIQEIELPRRFSVAFMDKDKDYLQSTQSSQRVLAPVATVSSNNEITLQIAAAFSVDFAKQLSEKLLYSAWIERSSYSMRTSWKFLVVDPGDIITLTTDDGTVFRNRIVDMSVGKNFTLDMKSISEDTAQYDSTVTADGGSGLQIQFFTELPTTKLILLCSPLLRDSDDTGRTTSLLYYMMGGFGQQGWRAATLFKSAEGTEFSDVGSIVNEMAYGSTSNALGDVSDPFSTDEINTLTVFMTIGGSQLNSVSQLEMVNGANPAALIHSNGIDVEIIQFRDVVQNGDGSFTLSGLLRGRRGSESFTDAHSTGNTFLLLDALTAEKLQLALSEVNQTRFYTGVTVGQAFEDAAIITKSSPGNDLKPYAPVSQAAAPSGNDIDFTWERRTRVGGGLKDGVGNVPVNEDSEAYEIDIFDGPGGSVVRTITGLSTTSTTYTSAQQTTDGFTPPLSQITIEIYQISAQVGRGFTKEVTLNVE